MNNAHRSVLAIVVSLGALAGCGGTSPLNATLTSIVVTPTASSIPRGAHQQYTAIGTYGDGTTKDLSSRVTWASTTTPVATISATGEATGVGVGTTLITATLGAIEGHAALSVMLGPTPGLVSIAVTPATTSIGLGTKQPFTATGTFGDNSTRDVTAMVTWASSVTAVATISATGEATGVGAGTTAIAATLGAVAGQATLTVRSGPGPKLVSISVTPRTPSVGIGMKQQLTATGVFDDNSTQNLTATATWTSATSSVATVSATGEATGVSPGTTAITATSGTVSGIATLSVVTGRRLVSIAITPAMPLVAKGTSQQLTATGFFVDGTIQDITTTVTWASANPATATVSNAAGTNGLVTAVMTGMTDISATSGTISGSTTLVVPTVPLLSIAVTPATPVAAKGSKVQFKATAMFGDNTTQDVTSMVTWASATPATATISNAAGTSGQATALAEGTTVITATSGLLKGTATLTVTSTTATLVSIAVTPPTPSIGKGTTLRFVATGTFSDATTQDLSTSVTWASATPVTATISNAAGSNGVATAINIGTTVISATLGAITGMTTLTVSTAKPVSIVVTPAQPAVAAGTKVQFVANAIFNDATIHDITPMVTWTSATPAVATISNDAASRGQATALLPGTTVISATLGAISGNTMLMVLAQ